ncbi:hypothetical protein B0H11DRAFT_1934500 [Mycena galericulata]|nr:hypothetical protein B0H11DRAFT_1934500 [Mycena galericulata]
MRNPQPSLPGQPADLRSPLPAASATRPIRNVERRVWFHALAFTAVAAPLFIMDVVLHFPRPQDPRPPRLAPLVLFNPVRVVMRVQISSKPRTDLLRNVEYQDVPGVQSQLYFPSLTYLDVAFNLSLRPLISSFRTPKLETLQIHLYSVKVRTNSGQIVFGYEVVFGASFYVLRSSRLVNSRLEDTGPLGYSTTTVQARTTKTPSKPSTIWRTKHVVRCAPPVVSTPSGCMDSTPRRRCLLRSKPMETGARRDRGGLLEGVS